MPLIKYRRYRPNHAAVLVPAGGATVGPPVPTYRTTAALSTGSGSTSFSQSSLNIVNAAADLLLVVGVTGNNNDPYTISSPTITPNGGGAINGTIVKTDSATVSVTLMQFAIPNGTDLTNATLAFTMSAGAFSNSQASFWTVPQADLASLTATDTKSTPNAAGTAASITTLALSAGGMVIAVASGGDFTATTTWTGTESYTERYDVPSGGVEHSGADASGVASSAGTTITATFTVSGAIRVTAASWR